MMFIQELQELLIKKLFNNMMNRLSILDYTIHQKMNCMN